MLNQTRRLFFRTPINLSSAVAMEKRTAEKEKKHRTPRKMYDLAIIKKRNMYSPINISVYFNIQSMFLLPPLHVAHSQLSSIPVFLFRFGIAGSPSTLLSRRIAYIHLMELIAMDATYAIPFFYFFFRFISLHFVKLFMYDKWPVQVWRTAEWLMFIWIHFIGLDFFSSSLHSKVEWMVIANIFFFRFDKKSICT